MIVLDASAAVDALLERRPQSSWVRSHLAGPRVSLHAPHLIDIEVAGAFRNYVLRGGTSSGQAMQALRVFANLRIERYPHAQLLDRIWELRDNLTAADAAYIALAEALDAPLVTTDRALASVPGHRARVEAFTGPF